MTTELMLNLACLLTIMSVVMIPDTMYNIWAAITEKWDFLKMRDIDADAEAEKKGFYEIDMRKKRD